MNCTEFNKSFAELDNGVSSAADSALPPSMQEHRATCAVCNAMVEDIALIARQARVLRPMEAPSDRVWRNIQTTLIAEGVIHSGAASVAESAHPIGRVLVMPPMPRRAPMGMAYAAMFAMAAGVMYLHSLITGPGAPPTLASRPLPPSIPMRDAMTTASEPDPGMVLAKQAEAQLAANNNVNEMVQRVPEEHRAMFVSSWNRENESIQQLMDVVQAFPDDPFIQMQLRNALVRQRMLQETPSRWNQ